MGGLGGWTNARRAVGLFSPFVESDPQAADKFVISGGGGGLHWEELDEDICVKSLLLGIGDRTRS